MSLSVSNGVLAGQAGVSALGSSGVVTGSGSAKNGIRVSGSGRYGCGCRYLRSFRCRSRSGRGCSRGRTGRCGIY